MTIANFICANIDTILDEWDRFAHDLPLTSDPSWEVLRDHAEGILRTIAADLEQAQTPLQEETKSTGHAAPARTVSQARQHGRDRVLEGFSLRDTMSEYRALRASVMRLWSRNQAAAQTPENREVIRFNEAIDQALTESLDGYADDKTRHDKLYDTLLSASPDLSFIIDTDTRLIYGNAALASEFGEPLTLLRGRRFAELQGHAQEQFEEHVRLVTRTKCTALGELARERRGVEVTYEYLLVPVRNARDEVEAVAGIARDISGRKAAEEQHRRSAQYDDLTGLPNRHLFRDRLKHEIKRADRIHLPLALLFVDLDGFKQVNDLLGHVAGDELLRQAAARMRECVRETDTVARLGGDEFTVILTEIKHMPHVYILAQQIVGELSRSFDLGGREVLVSASIGIAVYPNDAGGPTELVRHADQAMYAAKQSGSGRYCLFTEEMRNAGWVRLKRIGELRQAVTRHQFEVLYQPIVDLASNAVVGAEAQLCWCHPVEGNLPAHAFSDLAAEAGLVTDIGQLVLDDALERAGEWLGLRGSPLLLSIEQSSLALTGKIAEQQCASIIEKLHQARAPVALQITESMLLSEAPAVRNVLEQMAGGGIHLCLDAFGTGYSSITSLTRLPLAGVRIAAPVVVDVLAHTPRTVAKGIIASGHALGLKVIAEGVETKEQQAQLLAMGCDYAQGPLFFDAMEAGAFARLLAPPAGTPPAPA